LSKNENLILSMEEDIRWIQRFSNYRKALARLSYAVQLSRERDLSDLEQQGLIQAFEFTYELAWKTLKDIIIEKNDFEKSPGPNVIIPLALEEGLIHGEDEWDEMMKARVLTTHAYEEEMADAMAALIISKFHGMFIQLETRLQIEQLNQEKE
jgi:nucleotidyltransferase substrate binding protein (TIGR01987 family)